MKIALFLDRNGKINVEKNHVFRIEDFEFRPWIFDKFKKYLKRGI
jgi:D-glycero-D-manno-heptose 1,7-bisphosphate phosphatase